MIAQTVTTTAPAPSWSPVLVPPLSRAPFAAPGVAAPAPASLPAARSLFDVLHVAGSATDFVQAIPPSTYSLIVNGRHYIVVAMRGLQESAFLQRQRAQQRLSPLPQQQQQQQPGLSAGGEAPAAEKRGPLVLAPGPGGPLAPPVLVRAETPRSAGALASAPAPAPASADAGQAATALPPSPPSPVVVNLQCADVDTAALAFTDTLFLLLAYQWTHVAGLTLPQIVCLFDLALRLQLPLDGAEALRAAAGLADRVDALFTLLVAVARAVGTLVLPSPAAAAAALEGAIGQTLAADDTPDGFRSLAVTLTFAPPPALPAPFFPAREASARRWRTYLLDTLGRAFARDRPYPPAMLGSYVVYLADDLLDAAEAMGAAPRTTDEVRQAWELLAQAAEAEADEAMAEAEAEAGEARAKAKSAATSAGGLRGVAAEFEARVDRLYAEAFEAIEAWAAHAVPSCIVRWLGSLPHSVGLYVYYADGRPPLFLDSVSRTSRQDGLLTARTAVPTGPVAGKGAGTAALARGEDDDDVLPYEQVFAGWSHIIVVPHPAVACDVTAARALGWPLSDFLPAAVASGAPEGGGSAAGCAFEVSLPALAITLARSPAARRAFRQHVCTREVGGYSHSLH